MSRKAWLAIFMVMAITFPALAQKITDDRYGLRSRGEPAIGASVMVQGLTNVGAATEH